MKKYYTKEDICDIFTKYVRMNFESGADAARHYGAMTESGKMNRVFISNIKRHKAIPTKAMLKDIGFKGERVFIKDKGE